MTFFSSPARVPKAKRPEYPRHRGEMKTDVVIVGGGFTGCACAAVFAAAGVQVILLEAERIGAGATAAGSGLIRSAFDASFQESARAHGLRTARHLWQSQRKAALELAAALRRYKVRGNLARQDLLHVARGHSDGGRGLRREYQARRDAGLDVTWLTPAALRKEAAIDADGAIRMRGDVIDPYRTCLGLAAVASRRGALIHERSEVRATRIGRKAVEVRTASGVLTANTVVVATEGALPVLRALRRHLAPRQVYAVATEPLPAAVRRAVGTRAAALRDSADPRHLLRWPEDDRALFYGAEQRPVAPRSLDATLVQRAGQLMYELTTVYPEISGLRGESAWALVCHDTPDRLPLIGSHRNFPHHLFALGLGRHGPAASWLAARLLLRHHTGAPDRNDDQFGFARIL
jgi:glycine/D-amino acid oxidase-like deaminating enzyme